MCINYFSDSSYEFTRVEEYFLSLFGLSKSSLVFKILHGTLYKSNNEVYTMAVLESRDGRISVHEKKYVSSPSRLKNSISFVCNIKGVKYPLTIYGSEPFRNMNITTEEISNTLSLLCSEGILQNPIDYSSDSIYLATDIQLYDLLSEYAFLFEVSKLTLKKLWELRRPTPEEIQWLQRIEGNSEVAKSIARSRDIGQKRGLTYYNRQKKIRNIIEKISGTNLKETITERWNKKKFQQWIVKEYHETARSDAKHQTMKEWLEEEYQETRSNPRYQFIISEIEKFAFPNWFQRIKNRFS